MAIDFSQFAQRSNRPRLIHPVKLFHSLKRKDSPVNDLWLAQGDALREWHAARSEMDNAIVLNTGAGKTLVGLLAAQSLTNETQGKVLYACSSIQLVRQTESKAREYGLDSTTYYNRQYSNSFFSQGKSPCITTYHAIFNGLSTFRSQQIDGIVFDDAHSAGHILRDQFSLNITRSDHNSLFIQILAIFHPYFEAIGMGTSYQEVANGYGALSNLFVPPFIVKRHFRSLQDSLTQHNPNQHNGLKFSWGHLKDHIDLCAVFISSSTITITPWIIPVDTLDCFQESTRRLYLSATLSETDQFIRSFGRIPNTIIAPETTAGECERMILIPRRSVDLAFGDKDIQLAKEVLPEQKRLVITPSKKRGSLWQDVATNTEDSVPEQVEKFQSSNDPQTLVLTARYDGIDLPGDTCRLLIIDELPVGINPLEKYLWDNLGAGSLLKSTIAGRLVQSFGRISRGMNDHGIVLLTGQKLVEWIGSPRNQSLLPEFLRKQLAIGMVLSESTTAAAFSSLAAACLNRDAGWIQLYENDMGDESKAYSVESTTRLSTSATVEVRFGGAFWSRDYAKAARILEQNLDATIEDSRPLGAWHSLWLGYCNELLQDVTGAEKQYMRANGLNQKIPRFIPNLSDHLRQVSEQVASISDQLKHPGTHTIALPPKFDEDLQYLSGVGSEHQVTSSVEALGRYLGFNSSRPDKEFSSGPDVLWTTEDKYALGWEAKTEKLPSNLYYKRDIGQIYNHRQWILSRYDDIDCTVAFIGPLSGADSDSSPDEEIYVAALEGFERLGQVLRSALIEICNRGVYSTVEDAAESVILERHLSWGEVREQLELVRITSL